MSFNYLLERNENRKRRGFPIPEYGRKSSAKMSYSGTPDSKMLFLDKQIKDLYNSSKQTEMSVIRKNEVLMNLKRLLNNSGFSSDIFPIGSSLTKLASKNSDMDVTLISDRYSDRSSLYSYEINSMLDQLKNNLYMSDDYSKIEVISGARVPVMKFIAKGNIDCDLSIHNTVGVRNSYLVRMYSDLDERFAPLVFIVKKWAESQNIRSARWHTISSYCWTLMVVHYLQTVVEPAVLPVVMKLPQGQRLKSAKLSDLNADTPLPIWKSCNTLLVAQLFIGFLHYYSNFNYAQDGISILYGCVAQKSTLVYAARVSENSWKYLCIQEPFSLQNTASSVFDYSKWEKVKLIIAKSYDLISDSLILDSILEDPVLGLSVYAFLGR